MPHLPRARGPLSSHVLGALARPVHPVAPCPVPVDPDPDDFHLALYCCYELHYRGFDGVDPAWEWEPSLLAVRQGLEAWFEAMLQVAVGELPQVVDIEAELRRLAAEDTRPSLSRHLVKKPSLDEFREFVIHRSAYHLKEADPHTFAIPRLEGRTKAACVEIQADEYGGGREPLMHATLFATTMRALGLDPRYGTYLDLLPGVTLATVNLMSLFGLHRRLRGALVGHLALFEMTSTVPNRRYGLAARRLGLGPAGTQFFDEHVLADSVHEQVAVQDLAGSLVQDEPELAGSAVFGARALLALDHQWSSHLMGCWRAGDSSLYAGLRGQVAV